MWGCEEAGERCGKVYGVSVEKCVGCGGRGMESLGKVRGDGGEEVWGVGRVYGVSVLRCGGGMGSVGEGKGRWGEEEWGKCVGVGGR